MDIFGWLQLLIFVLVLWLLTKPMGLYLERVLDAQAKTPFDAVLKPVERLSYRLCGGASQKEQDWKQFSVALLLFSLVGLLFTYAVLRLQHVLPLNPQGLGPVPADLAFNTAASFTTNTNWQNYAGEATLSYFSQMVGLVFHNFVSAAAGIAVAAALVRGLARHSAKTVGSFWVDLVRINLYLFLPLCLVFALFLVSQGAIQNFRPYVAAHLKDPVTLTVPQKDENGNTQTDSQGQPVMTEQKQNRQIMAQGPLASQAAIKMLGTNGGGFFNANAAHPYENPTPLANFLQILSIFLIPSGLTYYLGRMVRNQRHGWTIWAVMLALFLFAFLVCWRAESRGNPRLQALGVEATAGNMEGKEVRFGIFGSALFATVTTDASCGAVNAMHDSFTPLGGMIPLFNIQLGEIVFGGVGAGLYGMLVFVVLAVFLTGLMVGRTPEYLGKKIEAYDVKVSVFSLLILIFSILGFTALAAGVPRGLAGLHNGGPHGLSEMLYAFSSATGNNGSAFGGLNGNSLFYNLTLGLAMLLGRFAMIVPIMALAGNMVQKKSVSAGGGSFPVWGATFALILLATILIVGALTFFPALALGPVVEHFLMWKSAVLF